MAVHFVKNPIPKPMSDPGMATRARVLVSSMEQRLFEQVLDEETGLQGPEAAEESGRGPEMNLLEEMLKGSHGTAEIRSRLQAMDPMQLQAFITAAYIKATAMGSGTAGWRFTVTQWGSAEAPPAVSSGEPQAPAGGEREKAVGESGLGSLSAFFESGMEGVAAVGYDPRGGTSYGAYQLSSKAGTMDRFIEFLKEHEPAWAKRLASAGPANTGGRKGKMPKVWKEIARENPERFLALQRRFVEKTHYLPALEAVKKATGVDLSRADRALQEVLWSTAVQHGPRRAARYFSRAIRAVGGSLEGPNAEAVIRAVYRMRTGAGKSFDSKIQKALENRFREEKEMALAMLRTNADEAVV